MLFLGVWGSVAFWVSLRFEGEFSGLVFLRGVWTWAGFWRELTDRNALVFFRNIVIVFRNMDIHYADPLLAEVSERSERLLNSMEVEIDRMMELELALQAQLDAIQIPIEDYNEPLDVRSWNYPRELDSDYDDSEAKHEEVFDSPDSQEHRIRFNPDVFMIQPGQRSPAWHGRQLDYDDDDATVAFNYTPFYYITNEFEDSDTDTLVDFEWENPYLSPFGSADEDD